MANKTPFAEEGSTSVVIREAGAFGHVFTIVACNMYQGSRTKWFANVGHPISDTVFKCFEIVKPLERISTGRPAVAIDTNALFKTAQ
jgi:hypothetical protein